MNVSIQPDENSFGAAQEGELSEAFGHVPDQKQGFCWQRVLPLLAILVLAATVRLGVGIYRSEQLLQEGNGIRHLHQIAANLAAGRGYICDNGVPNVFQQPGYPYALAVGYWLCGPTWQGVLLTNTIIGCLLVLVVYQLTLRLTNRQVALLAALLTALYPYLLWNGVAISDTSLFSLTLLGYLSAVVTFVKRPRKRTLCAAGLWLAAGILTRPSILPLAPLGLLLLLWHIRPIKTAMLQTAAICVIAAVAILPWCLRNYNLTGQFPLIGTHGPDAMFYANNPDAVHFMEIDSSADIVAEMPHYLNSPLNQHRFQSDVTPRQAVLAQQAFTHEVRTWITENPATFARISWLRLLRIWDVRYHPIRFGEQIVPSARMKNCVHIVSFAPLLILAIIGGLLMARKPGGKTWLLFFLAILAIYSLAHCVGAGYSRVRLPIDPLLMPPAALALSALLDYVFRRVPFWQDAKRLLDDPFRQQYGTRTQTALAARSGHASAGARL